MPIMRTIRPGHDVEFTIDTFADLLIDPHWKRKTGKTWGWECDCESKSSGHRNLGLAIEDARSALHNKVGNE